jgi:outer membrane autotransporter protein
MSIKRILGVTIVGFILSFTAQPVWASGELIDPYYMKNMDASERETSSALNEAATKSNSLQNQYNALNDGEKKQTREELTNENAVGTNNAIVDVAGTSMNSSVDRLNEIREVTISDATNFGPSGPSGPSGSASNGLAIWTQGIHVDVDQDARDHKNGYHYDTQSGIVGIDKTIGNYALGLSLGYADTDVKSDRIDYKTDIDTLQVGLYGAYFTDNYYINGGLSLGFSDVDSRRKLTALGLTAKGDTDARSASYFLDSGYVFKLDKWTLTPNAGIAYTYVETDGYAERGANVWNQKISENNTDSFVSKLGVKANYQFSKRLLGELRGSWSHEYVNHKTRIKARFDLPGTKYREFTGLKPDLDSFRIGTGFVGAINENLVGFLNYDLELKDDYVGHTTMLGLRYSF